MNLFRSEEHIRNWAQFDPSSEEGIISIEDVVRLFSCELFRRRLEPGYLSRIGGYRKEFWDILEELGQERPFWMPPGR